MVGNLVKIKKRINDVEISPFIMEKNKLTRLRIKDISTYNCLLYSFEKENNFLDSTKSNFSFFKFKKVSFYIIESGNKEFLSFLSMELLEKRLFKLSHNEYKLIKCITLFSKEKNVLIGTGGFSIIELETFQKLLNIALENKKTTCLEITYPSIQDNKLDTIISTSINDIYVKTQSPR